MTEDCPRLHHEARLAVAGNVQATVMAAMYGNRRAMGLKGMG